MRNLTSLFKPIAISLFAVAIMAFAQGSAKATAVTFSTTASFNGGAFSSPNAIVFGGGGNQLSLTFTGVTNSMVNTDPAGFTNTSLGQIQTAVTGFGAFITPGTTFAIRVTQTAPSGGSGDFSAVLSGAVTQNNSTGEITFSVTHVEINGVHYNITSNPLDLVPPSTNNGITSIQARITTVPEPTSMMLLGTGLLGLAGAARRRFARK